MLGLSLLALLAAALSADPSAAITATLDDFTQGAATRDVARVSRALHPEARQYVATADGMQVIDTAGYLQLLADGTIGGTPTTRATVGLEVSGTHALVHQTRDIGPMVLHDAATLVRGGAGWQIVSVAVTVEKKGG